MAQPLPLVCGGQIEGEGEGRARDLLSEVVVGGASESFEILFHPIGLAKMECCDAGGSVAPVSYTHLTLPTN